MIWLYLNFRKIVGEKELEGGKIIGREGILVIFVKFWREMKNDWGKVIVRIRGEGKWDKW